MILSKTINNSSNNFDYKSSPTAKNSSKKITEPTSKPNTNTVTTFSRMDEDEEPLNDEANFIYGAPEEKDNRVP